MAFVPRLAQADGGIVRARETRGPFLITIFTPSEVFTAAPLEVSVMVQDRETNQVVMDAVVELSLAQPNESKKQSEIGGHRTHDWSYDARRFKDDAPALDHSRHPRAGNEQTSLQHKCSFTVDWRLDPACFGPA